MSKPFRIHEPYQPAGDQPKAILALSQGIAQGLSAQTLLGVTGSGKTFTVAEVIQRAQMPTLVVAHNKTLAAQLCNEFREFFPENAVEYFVSYYDYYQPEAYIPSSDTYIEKDAAINEEIDRLRHACTQALLTREDVIIVASVSCIYGLGSPKEYEQVVVRFSVGQSIDRRAMLDQLIALQFTRTNADVLRGTFRVVGRVVEIMPVNEETIYRMEIGDTVQRIERIDPITRQIKSEEHDAWFFPAKHYIAGPDLRECALKSIAEELEQQLAVFEKQGKVLEHERLRRRVRYDMEMIRELGYCNGIENYSRHFDGRSAGEPAYTLLDFFSYNSTEKKNTRKFLTVIDESHATVPQIRGMFAGDRSRKDTLVEHGFRLPSARDNRPLMHEEFAKKIQQVVYVSATPSQFELQGSQQVVEQIVRPTGLVDPTVTIAPIVRADDPSYSQISDVLSRAEAVIARHERVLVTTLTKKMAEDLTDYLKEKKIRVQYLHSDVDTLDRIEIIMALRKGDIDVIVGVNLLREGLDMPEVSLVVILDADKEGFLRSETSLIQTIGRAARNINGEVVLYADTITGSMERAIAETTRRRNTQLAHNKEYGITPETIKKTIRNLLEEFGITKKSKNKKTKSREPATPHTGVLDLDLIGDTRSLSDILKDKEQQMRDAAQALEFELAAILRDEVREIRARLSAKGETNKKTRKKKV